MVNLALLVRSSLISGVVLSLLLGGVIMGSIYVNPEIWVNDYPPDVKRKFGPIGEKAKKQRTVVGIVFFVILLGLLALSIGQLFRSSGGNPGFGAIFLSIWIILMFFNLFDFLVLDWLIMMRVRPKFAILPGTEGMSGYDDYGFLFRGFVIGNVFSLVASLVIAGIVVLGAAIIT